MGIRTSRKKHLRLSPIIFCLNDNPWLTYFMARSFCNLGLNSSEIIASCDWEVGLSLLKMTSDILVKDFIEIFSATSVKFQCYFSEISMIFFSVGISLEN